MKHKKHEFDEFAQNYHEDLDKNLNLSGESSSYFAHLKIKKLKEWLPAYTDKKSDMLDFGCGDGMMTSFLKKEYATANIFGVDPSGESINVAQKKYKNISFDVSGKKIPFGDKKFDLITAAGVFHHIEFSKHEHYAQEVLRVLKPGGTFVMFELNPLNPGTQWIFRHNPIDKNAKMLTPWYAKKLLKKHGTVSTKFYSFFPGFLGTLRFTEKYMTSLPLGALVAYIFQPFET